MRLPRTAVAATLLLVEAGIAVLGVLVHYGLTAEYGDITDSALEGLRSGHHRDRSESGPRKAPSTR